MDDIFTHSGRTAAEAAKLLSTVFIFEIKGKHGYTPTRGLVRRHLATLMRIDLSKSRYFTSAVMTELEMIHGQIWVDNKDQFAVEDTERYLEYLRNAEAPTNFNQTKEQETMIAQKSNVLFEKRVFINGQNAESMTDDEIFNVIKNAEAEVEALEMINNRPEKLGKKIEKLYKQIEKVKAYVDNR